MQCRARRAGQSRARAEHALRVSRILGIHLQTVPCAIPLQYQSLVLYQLPMQYTPPAILYQCNINLMCCTSVIVFLCTIPVQHNSALPLVLYQYKFVLCAIPLQLNIRTVQVLGKHWNSVTSCWAEFICDACSDPRDPPLLLHPNLPLIVPRTQSSTCI